MNSSLQDFSRVFNNNTGVIKTYYVQLKVSLNSCDSIYYDSVMVYPNLEAKISADDDAICAPDTLEILNTSIGASNYTWTFDDSYTSDSSTSILGNYEYPISNPFPDSVLTYRVYLKASNSVCFHTDSLILSVYPEIKPAISPDESSGCSGLTVNWRNTTTGGELEWNWDFGNTETGIDRVDTISYVNRTNDDKWFHISLYAKNEIGCDTITHDSVFIYREVDAKFAIQKTLCAPVDVTLSNNSLNGDIYKWVTGRGDTLLLDNTNDSIIVYNPTLLNNFQDYTIELYAVDTLHTECSDTTERSIRVLPEVISNFNITVGATGCSPDTATFYNISTGYKLEYSWKYTNDEFSNTDSIEHSHTFTNRSGNDWIYNVELVAHDSIGCYDTVSHPVTVFPLIEPKFTFSKLSPCGEPIVVELQNNSLNGTQFIWDFGNGEDTILTHNGDLYRNFTHLNDDPNIIDTFNIQLLVIDTNHPQCSDSITKSIKIFPPVVADFDFTGSGDCAPLDVAFGNNSSGYGLSYYWDYGDESFSTSEEESHFYENQTTDSIFNVKLTVIDSIGCSSVVYHDVIIYPEVISDFAFTKGPCTPFIATFNATETATSGFKYEWIFGDGDTTIRSNILPVRHTYNNTSESVYTHNVKLIKTNIKTRCFDDTTKQIKVHPELIPGYAPVDNISNALHEGCNPLTVNFIDTTKGGASNEISLFWDFGDGQTSPQNNPSHELKHFENKIKKFVVTQTATQLATGCKKTYSDSMLVYSYLNASFGLTSDENKNKNDEILGGCTPFDVQVIDSSISNREFIWTFNNPYDDDETAYEPINKTLTYTNTDTTVTLADSTFNIKIVVVNTMGCKDSLERSVAVYPRGVPRFNLSSNVDDNGIFCHPAKITSDNISIANSNYSFYWRSGDGIFLNQENFTHTYRNNSYTELAQYKINLIVQSNHMCRDSISELISIHPKPSAIIETDDDIACSPYETELINASLGNTSTNDLDYIWNLDDGNGDFVIDDNSSVNNTFSNENLGSILKTYNVRLIAISEFNCSDTMDYPIKVYPKITSDFSMDKTDGCSPVVVHFSNETNPSGGFGATSYLWILDESTNLTSTLVAPIHPFENVGEQDTVFNIRLIAKSQYGCVDTSEYQTLTVFLSPNADFLVYNPGDTLTNTFQYPNRTQIKLVNSVIEGPDLNYFWDFGDGSTSIEKANPLLYTYNNWGPAPDFDYTIRLEVRNSETGCNASDSLKIFIFPPTPIIEINNDSVNGCEPFPIHFGSTWNYAPGTNIYWNFDDGTTINDTAPFHTFSSHGIYNVSAKIIGDGGTKWAYQKIEVYPKPITKFEFVPAAPKVVMLPDDVVTFFNQTEGGVKYIWDFGNGDRKNVDGNTPVEYIYQELGTWAPYLISISDKNCYDTLYSDLRVLVQGEGLIQFPNGFLPIENADESGAYVDLKDNTVFHPFWTGVKTFELWIFNRWGEQIFYSDDINMGWNGRYGNNGKDMEQDVYFWKTKGTFQNDNPFKQAGDLTLIRFKTE
ncbi:MAG: gliding motility-associated C-terminal domain-containing protein [Salinivirgaceae bacterium]|nr:gliding motility-associated C-terminal domain-containing protein [Salinivirgaceae bacterium]